MQRGVDLTRHQEQARTLNPEPYVDLYEVRVNPSAVVRLTNHPNVSWAGSEWENWAVELNGLGAKTTGEVNRPQLRLANLGGLFSPIVAGGLVYQGSVTRYRVLIQDLHDGRVSYLRNFWEVSRVASLSKDAIVLELRAPMDRQDYSLPARQFIAPEFPYVTLN
jgi:phage-related protein